MVVNLQVSGPESQSSDCSQGPLTCQWELFGAKRQDQCSDCNDLRLRECLIESGESESVREREGGREGERGRERVSVCACERERELRQ